MGIKKIVLPILLLICLKCAYAQQGHDALAWIGVSVRLPLDITSWTVEGSYQYLTYQRASRFYLHFGSLYVFYRIGKTSLTLSPGYVLGQVDELGLAQLVQLRLIQKLPLFKLQPQLRLTLDRLQFNVSSNKGSSPPAYTRVRTQLALEPMLSNTLQLMVNTEPFVYHSEGWLSEIRSQAGIRWLLLRHLSAEVSYFNRWRGYDFARVAWEHAVMIRLILQKGQRDGTK